MRQAVGRNVIFFGYKLQLFLDRDAPLHENVSKHDQLLMPFLNLLYKNVCMYILMYSCMSVY